MVACCTLDLHPVSIGSGRVPCLPCPVGGKWEACTRVTERGFGVLQIHRKDVQLIEFDGYRFDLNGKSGVGYLQRSFPKDGNGSPSAYEMNSFSYRKWFKKTEAVNLVVSFGERDRKKDDFRMLTTEVRYLRSAFQKANHHGYMGGGLGLISLRDEAIDVSGDANLQLSVFWGIEYFPVSLPGLGISGEVGLMVQRAGDQTSRSLFSSGFPALSLHYYF